MVLINVPFFYMKSLTRSDTLPAIEPPPWSNTRPPGGPTPIPPRNEPMFYLPSDDLPPELLKLRYLFNGMKFEGDYSPSLSDALKVSGMESYRQNKQDTHTLSIGDSKPTNITKPTLADSKSASGMTVLKLNKFIGITSRLQRSKFLSIQR